MRSSAVAAAVATLLAGCLGSSPGGEPGGHGPEGPACAPGGEGDLATACAAAVAVEAAEEAVPERPVGHVLEMSVLAGHVTFWSWSADRPVRFQLEEHAHDPGRGDDPVVRAFTAREDLSIYTARTDATLVLRWSTDAGKAELDYRLESDGIPPY